MSCTVATVQGTETVLTTSYAERSSNLQTTRPAVELSLDDDQEMTSSVPTVNVQSTSYKNGLLRTPDDDGMPDEQWETTSAFPIPKDTGETYKDLIAKVQIGGSEAFKEAAIDMLNEPEFSTLLSTSLLYPHLISQFTLYLLL